jgi:hypothetical protein
MPLVRTVLALLIMISVAMLPIAGGAAFKLKPQATTEVSSAEPMDDCCPPAAKTCASTMLDCASMASCALKCFAYSDVEYRSLYLLRRADLVPLFGSAGLTSQAASPPFRPPRA